MAGLDYKKEYKDLYQPKNRPSIINVPKMTFIQVEGRGNPNTCQAVSYTHLQSDCGAALCDSGMSGGLFAFPV